MKNIFRCIISIATIVMASNAKESNLNGFTITANYLYSLTSMEAQSFFLDEVGRNFPNDTDKPVKVYFDRDQLSFWDPLRAEVVFGYGFDGGLYISLLTGYTVNNYPFKVEYNIECSGFFPCDETNLEEKRMLIVGGIGSSRSPRPIGHGLAVTELYRARMTLLLGIGRSVLNFSSDKASRDFKLVEDSQLFLPIGLSYSYLLDSGILLGYNIMFNYYLGEKAPLDKAIVLDIKFGYAFNIF